MKGIDVADVNVDDKEILDVISDNEKELNEYITKTIKKRLEQKKNIKI